MTKISARKQLLLQSALVLSLSGLAAFPAMATTYDVVSTPLTNTNFKLTGSPEEISIVPGGDITDNSHDGINLNGDTASLINVATGNISTGIITTNSSYAAIDGSASGSILTNLTIDSGIVTSNASTGTIVLGGTASSPTIDVEGGSLTNTGNGSVFTTGGGTTNNTNLTLINKGTITSTSASPTINIIDTNGGSSANITNSGNAVLGAVGGIALHLGSATGVNSGTISNSGTIDGDLDGGTSGNNTITVTSNTGNIAGNIYTFGGNLSITQGSGGNITGNIYTTSGDLTLIDGGNSTVTGNVSLGSAAASSIALNGTSSIAGSITMGNASQTVTFNSTATDVVAGTIDGPGIIIVDTSAQTDGVIGGNVALTNITVNSGATFTLANDVTATTTILAGNMTVNNGSLLTGNVTIDNGGLLKVGTTAVAGTINGDAAGDGTLEITSGNVTSGGNIGLTYALGNITVDTGANFTLANNADSSAVTVNGNGTLTVDSAITLSGNGAGTAITLGSGNSTLDIAGTVSGTINGAAVGDGIVNIDNTSGTVTQNGVIGGNAALSAFNVDNTASFAENASITAGNITIGGGTSGNLAQSAGTLDGTTGITVASGGNLTQTAGNISTPTLTINGTGIVNESGNITGNIVLGAAGSTFNYDGGTFSGLIDGAASGDGILEVSSNFSPTGVIGGGNLSLANIEINSNKTLTLADNASATDFTLASHATLAIGDATATGAALLGNSAEISFTNADAIFDGTIDGNGGTHGKVLYNASGATFTTDGDIGDTHPVWNVTVNDGTTLDIVNAISARTIDIGEGGAGATAVQSASTTVATTNGLLVDTGSSYTLNGGALDSSVALGGNSTFTIGTGTSSVTGAIDGNGSAEGTVDINHNYTNTAAIGSTHGIAALNIAADDTLTLGADVKATTITASGTLDAGAGGYTVAGNLGVAATTGTLNLEGVSTTLTGNLTTGSGSIIDSTITGASTNDNGSLTISGGGTASLTSGTKLVLNAPADFNPGASGVSYTILTSAGLTDTGIGSNITVLDSGDSNANIFTSAAVTANADDLIVKLTHLSFGYYAANPNEAAVGTALDSFTSTPGGNLGTFYTAVNNAQTAAIANALLNEAEPQVDNGVPTITFDNADVVANTVQLRMASLRDGSDTDSDTGMAAGDPAFKNRVWLQGFGQHGDQDNSNGEYGYKANTGGAALGIDHQIDSINGYGGLSFSYANSSIDSNDDLKTTTADSYQVNLYGTKKFNNSWYLDGLVGAAYNEFSTDRTILTPVVKAEGDFNGETYMARIGTGRDFALGNGGWSLTPGATLTYAYSTYQSYTETNAGTLDLNVSQDNTQELQSKIGSGIGYSYTTSGGTIIRPAVHAAWLYNIVNDGQADTSTFTGGGASFATKGLTPERNGADLGADLNIYGIRGVDILADYDFEKRSDYTSNTGILRLRYSY